MVSTLGKPVNTLLQLHRPGHTTRGSSPWFQLWGRPGEKLPVIRPESETRTTESHRTDDTSPNPS